ncbi:MAG: CDP-alcohol phosphatidyltransferase family protein [Acidimicrobiales bacterium]
MAALDAREPASRDPEAGEPASSRRVWTVPNALSVGRLLCTPLVGWLLLGPAERLAAAWLLAVLGATDFLDGFVARALHQVSDLGKVLDPLADRVLLAVAVVAALVAGDVPVPVGLAVVAREVLVAAGVLALAALGVPRVDVILLGKAGTFALMVAFPFFLAGHSRVSWHGGAEAVGWVAAIAGLVLAWAAAAAYLLRAKRALVGARVGRQA